MTPMFDVAIVGGGMVGATLALALGQAGKKVALLERQPAAVVSEDSVFDLRISALNRRSEKLLRGLGVWDALLPSRLQAYQSLLAFEAASTTNQQAASASQLEFTAAELGESHLGHMVENIHLQQALWQQLPETVQLFCPVTVYGYQETAEQAVLHTSSGDICAKLLVAADGAQSQLKQLAGIGSSGWQYQQACMLVHVSTAAPSSQQTWQQFTEQGPRAYLPLPGHEASLVWYDDHLRIQQLSKLSPAQLAQEIRAHFPTALGDFTVHKAGYFPLTRSHANHYVKGRVVLCGDAAHTINPLAGQGVNLGFADVECLAKLLNDNNRSLADALAHYETERRRANLLMMSAMDLFYQVFKRPFAPLRLARRMGLQLAANAGPLKTLVGKYAAGL